MPGATVELCFDYASPFSYLADSRIDAVLAALPVTVRRVPVYLRGFDAFRDGVPFSAAKLRYLRLDLARCARAHGIPLGPLRARPIDGLHLLRAHLALDGLPEQDAFRRAAWRATWVDGLDTSDPEIVMAVARDAGVDRGSLAQDMRAAAVKARLRANTERAIARHAFGVPTIYVGDEMFWGNDRL